MNPYTTLGVERTADAATIKRAYRRAAKHAHPDRGGSASQMVAVNVAYDILSDPRRKERFDLGQEDEPTVPPVELMARNKLAGAFLKFAVAQPRLNLVASAKSQLQEDRRAQRHALAELARVLERLQARLADVSFEGDGPNVFADALNGGIANLTHQRGRAEQELAAIERALELLAAYRSGVIEPPFRGLSGVLNLGGV